MKDLKTMLLVTAPWTESERTFRMIPASNDCPYIDVVFNKDRKALEITSNFRRMEFGLLPKLDDNGDIEKRKTPKNDPDTGQAMLYKQERKSTEVLQKYFILDQVEIISFVQAFAINADKVDYMQHFQDAIITPDTGSKIIMPS
jgi:hypothetical protein